MTANTGKIRDNSDINRAIIPSSNEINGLTIPAVPAVLAVRTAVVVSCEMEAVPPPAMIAILHFRNGSISPINAAVNKIPAVIAAGVAIIFMTWSTSGIYDETISNKVATAKATSAGVVSIQLNESTNVTKLAFAAILVMRSGVKTRKPTAALKPIPMNIAIIYSMIATPLTDFFFSYYSKQSFVRHYFLT